MPSQDHMGYVTITPERLERFAWVASGYSGKMSFEEYQRESARAREEARALVTAEDVEGYLRAVVEERPEDIWWALEVVKMSLGLVEISARIGKDALELADDVELHDEDACLFEVADALGALGFKLTVTKTAAQVFTHHDCRMQPAG